MATALDQDSHPHHQRLPRIAPTTARVEELRHHSYVEHVMMLDGVVEQQDGLSMVQLALEMASQSHIHLHIALGRLRECRRHRGRKRKVPYMFV